MASYTDPNKSPGAGWTWVGEDPTFGGLVPGPQFNTSPGFWAQTGVKDSSVPNSIAENSNAAADPGVVDLFSSGGSTGGSSYAAAPSGPSASQQQAATNLGTIAGFNAESSRSQLAQQIENYGLANTQNRSLADVQNDQNARKASGDRFAANKKLQTATQGVLGTAGNALNGSSLFSLLNMLSTRTDLDNNAVWDSLTQNRNAVENAFTEAVNANVLSQNDAASNAEYGLRGIEADTAAQMNNIDSSLFTAPGTGTASVGATGTYAANKLPANIAQLAGYIMPDAGLRGARETQAANTLTGNSYYDRLLNQYNQNRSY